MKLNKLEWLNAHKHTKKLVSFPVTPSNRLGLDRRETRDELQIQIAGICTWLLDYD